MGVWIVPAAGAATGDAGYPVRSFSGAGTDPAGSKPQSKLWFNDGTWWADMWDAATGDHHIFRLDASTQTWRDTGVPLDTRSNTRSDTLWDGTHLYVASHAFATTSSSGGPSRLFRYRYDPATDVYALDMGFPVSINAYKTETLVLDKDSTGRLWATWVQGTDVYVTHTLADDRTWATPFRLPVDGASGLATDDISTLVAFGGSKIGVMWSNQNASAFYFAVHLDGQPPDRWQASEVALGGPLNVDDHINVKAGSDGRVIAAVKTSQTTATAPGTMVLARAAGGDWSRHVLTSAADKAGRPILLLDEANAVLHAFLSTPEAGGTIYHKTSPLEGISFAAGLGTPFLRNAASASMNDATSTKQLAGGATGLTVLGGHKSTSTYWHNHVPLPATPVPPLAAGFAATPTSGSAPLDVAFADTSAGAPTSWAWDFGDGSPSSSDRHPSHAYTEPGSYTVRLTVTDAQGNVSTRERPHYVTALPLTARFTATPRSGRVPLTVAFTDGSIGTPTSWTWDFGDGSAVSHEQNPRHVYATAGTFDVSLTVEDRFGRTSTAMRSAYVTALPLTAEFTATPSTGRVPLTVAFKDTTLGTPTSWTWDFGDGTPTSGERNPTHVYRFPGTYTVTLRVGDAAGNTSTKTRTDLIAALPLAADFTATPTSGAAPLTVAFKDASLGTPTSWTWDFGDGTPTSSERNPSHSYAETGSYTVKLTAVDAAGNTSTKEKAAYVTVLPLTADFAVSPATGAAPLTVRFSDTSIGTPTSWSWDFGDSTRPSSERNPTHTYDRPGAYTVTLRVSDARGDTSTRTRQDVVIASADTVLKPVADAYVKSTSPTTNYATATTVRVKNGGTSESYKSYLRFDVPALAGPVTAAKLRLFVTDSSAYGGHVYPVTAAWTETGVTWSNAPGADGGALARLGNAPLNTWIAADLPAGGFGGPGPRSFLIQQDVTDSSAYYSSRQGANPPQLVLTVAFPPANEPPVARDDAATVEENRTTTIDVLSNDDPGPAGEAAQALVVDAITGVPSHGTATLTDAGDVTYAPEAGHLGADRFSYRVCDDGSPNKCATASVDVDVEPVNDPPVARADAVVTDEDTPVTVDVLTNDEPGDEGQALTLDALTAAPAHGVAEIAGATVRYAPAANYNGADSIGYRVCDDGEPRRCATATLDVTVAAVNDRPLLRADDATLDEDAAATIAVLANDAPGPGDESGQRLAIESIETAPAQGSAEVTDDGRVRYAPGPDYAGEDGFSYRACDDGAGAQCATAAVEITVQPVNDAPLGRDDAATLPEDAAVAVDVLSNDAAGPANEALQGLAVAAVTAAPEHGTAEIIAEGPAAGRVRYSPHADYHGRDAFGYRLCDDAQPSLCATASVAVTVEPVNDAPSALGDATTAVEDGAPIILDVLANDQPGPADELGQTLTVEGIAAAPANGTAEVVAEGEDAGKLRYTPAPDFFGTDSLEYRVCDDGAPTACATAAVEVTVTGVNDPPLARDDSVTVAEGATATIDVLPNDEPGPGGEPGEGLRLDAVTVGPARGTAAVIADGPDAGKVRYTAAGGYFPADAFLYSVCENGGEGLCSTARVTVKLAIAPTAETVPVPHAGDAADDAAIWVNPADPAASTVIGTDKQGGIAVYDLAGGQIEYRADGRMNNVDLRPGFPLGGETVALVTASNMTTDALAVYRVDPSTGRLADVAARAIQPGFEPYGLCMYRSSLDDRFYVFITSRVGADLTTTVEQWELFADESARVDARRVRGFTVAGESEGCVADDELGHLYVAQEGVAIWKYSAEPGAGDARVMVDAAGRSGQLEGDVEGLAIAHAPGGTGYLLASSQDSDAFSVYERAGENAHVRNFRIAGGEGIDGTEGTNGIAVTSAHLGPAFPSGLFVAHDDVNGLENENFKLVPLDAIVGADAEPPDAAGCTRPYADSSPWNTPIAADAAYEPNSEINIAALEGVLTSDAGRFTYPVYEVDSATPREEVTVSGWYSEVTDGGSTLVNHRRGTPQLPLPAGAAAAAGSDAQIVMVDEATGDEWGASHLERDATGRWTAWNAYRYNTRWSGVPPHDASDRPFFARGAGLPYLAGLVRPCEIARGRIDHALAFAYNYATQEYVSPATKSDGNAWDGVEDELDSHPGDMPEGARLQLDPTISTAEIRSWGCTGPCMVIARALQEYGMYIIDNAGRPKVMLEYDGTAVWDGVAGERTPTAIPLSAFKLVELGPRQSSAD